MIKNILFVFLSIIWLNSYGQSSPSELKNHFKALSKAQKSYLPKAKIEAYYRDEVAVQTIAKYVTDKNPKVQQEAVRLMAKVGSHHQGLESRQRAVFELLTAAQTASDLMLEKIATGLEQFKVTDYEESAIAQLRLLIEKKPAHLKEYIKIAGFLQLKEDLTALKEPYKSDKDLHKNLSIALARSGDEQKMEVLLKSVSEMPVDDDFVYGVVPVLAYTRQKAATDFLFDIILSDEKTCTPAGPDVPGKILCGYRVMEEIAPYVEGFPVEVGASGDLKVRDYQAAIKLVRQWIKIHREDYKLNMEIY